MSHTCRCHTSVASLAWRRRDGHDRSERDGRRSEGKGTSRAEKAEEECSREDREDHKDGRQNVKREQTEGHGGRHRGKKRRAKRTDVPRPRYELRERACGTDVTVRRWTTKGKGAKAGKGTRATEEGVWHGRLSTKGRGP